MFYFEQRNDIFAGGHVYFLYIDNWLSAVKNGMSFFFEYHYNFVKMTKLKVNISQYIKKITHA